MRILIVHHTVSPPLQELLERTCEGLRGAAAELGVADLAIVKRPALTAGPADVLGADAIVLGTPANIGYMSGALKHFFDQIYYPCLDAAAGLPYGIYVHGNSDTAGAVTSITTITKALQWRPVAAPVSVTGHLGPDTREALTNLTGLLLATA